MEAFFNRFTLELTEGDAMSVSVPGQDAQEECEYVVGKQSISEQLDTIGQGPLRDELREYGAWNEEQLADDEDNRLRIVWIAGGNIREEGEE